MSAALIGARRVFMALSRCVQSLPLDCLGLAKAAALVRIGIEQTALALTLGPSQPDNLLPPDAVVQAMACRQEDVAAGEAAINDAVRAGVMAAEAVGSMQGAPTCQRMVASPQAV